MSTDRGRFWSRVGHWFRTPARDAAGGTAAESELLSSSEPMSDFHEPMSAPPITESTRLGSRLRFSSREAAIERLEEGYQKVVNLVESIQRHLAVQEERSAIVAQSLARLADSLERTPEWSAEQRRLLEGIARSADGQTGALQRIEGSLVQLPALADAQRESVTSISRQLDATRQTHERVSAAVDGFRTAATAVGESCQASAAEMRQMQEAARQGEARVAAMFQEQSRRFTVFAMVVGAVGVVSAIIGLVAMLR